MCRRRVAYLAQKGELMDLVLVDIPWTSRNPHKLTRHLVTGDLGTACGMEEVLGVVIEGEWTDIACEECKRRYP